MAVLTIERTQADQFLLDVVAKVERRVARLNRLVVAARLAEPVTSAQRSPSLISLPELAAALRADSELVPH
jgi:hypothetical protein